MNKLEDGLWWTTYYNHLNVETYTDLIDISLEYITDGTLCYIKSDDKYYYYTQSNGWTELTTGSGSGNLDSIVTLSTDMNTNISLMTGKPVVITFEYITTCNVKTGKLTVTNNGSEIFNDKISEGTQVYDITKYMENGINEIEITVEDYYGNVDFLIYNINLFDVSIKSSFNPYQVFKDTIIFNFTAIGTLSKNVYILIDDKVVSEHVVTTSGVYTSVRLPKQTHGEHILKAYIEYTADGETIRSNELIYHILCLDENADTPVISVDYNETEIDQYTIITIPYMVATPDSLTSNIELYMNDELISTNTIPRGVQDWTLTDYPVGELVLKIVCGSVSKTITINVKEVEFKLKPKEENLQLYLTSKNRLNDSNKENWNYEDISVMFNNFTWVSDGWQTDDDGINTLRIKDNATIEIPFKPFEEDFKGTGKTIEFEFMVTDATNYDDVVISCMSYDRGFYITCKEAVFKSNELTISTKFKDNERIRVSFVIESVYQNRIVSVYVNGILSGLARYTTGDVFIQSRPVSITAGTSSCTLDIYNVRVYESSLSNMEALHNYIYDTINPSKKMELYAKNNLYDEYGNLSYSRVSNMIPCMTIIGELPPVKGNKKYVQIKYENKQDPSRNFDEENVKIDIQGTSSQYYPKKNYKFTLNNDYQLRPSSIPERVYCVKADYMESSHAHNTGMAKIVHGMYSEYVPGQTEDNGVRTTIDGFPIVIFHQESANSPRTYVGIYNFNNDKDDTDTFGYVDGTECWEICNNTSTRTLFQESDYTKLDVNGKPDWQNDFEARYPDKNTDYTSLKRLTDWIVSTDGNLTKFKNEFQNYFNLHYMLIYAVLTDVFAMVDSRAKNMFLASWDKTIWRPVFYDMDTVCGLNNEGVLTFDYNVEFNDVIGNQNVYNGRNSLLWQNFEAAFKDEITETYNELRNSGKLTYESVLEVFEGEQISVLCEALYNEDGSYKYLDPLLSNKIETYLYIAQGSRINHLKYWLFNRFNYLDSKYGNSDNMEIYATMRLYTPSEWNVVEPNADFEITPYAHQYSTIKFGSYVISTRSYANEMSIVEAPEIEFNDTETIIYGADRIASLGDLSNKYAGTVDLSNATQLVDVIIGNDSKGYTNTNLHSVSVGNNKLLRKVNVCNCPNLTDTLDLSECISVEEVYATGTGLSNINFSDRNTSLKKLTLPRTISNLTLVNKKNLEILTSEGYGSLSTLRIENSNIDPFTIIDEAINLEYIRLVGIDCVADRESIKFLQTLKGIDADGIEVDLSKSVYGKVTIPVCSKILLAEFEATFPNVTFTVLEYGADYTVTFLDGDGNVLEVKSVMEGESVEYTGETPTKTSTTMFDFEWSGWDKSLDNITMNTIIIAIFTSVLRKFSVKFYRRDTGELIDEQEVGYDDMPIPPHLPEGLHIWTPKLTRLNGKDQKYYAEVVDIPYPDDLSIFEFTEYTKVINSDGSIVTTEYICKLLNNSALPESLIIPCAYEGMPVIRYEGSEGSDGNSTITNVYIPDSVKIGNYAFYNFSRLTSVVLSDNVTNLGDYCFAGCTSLASISLPNVTNLGRSCFSGCDSLTSISLPNATNLDESCFSGCDSLTSISLPNVTKIGNYCFHWCIELEFVYLPKVTNIGYSCFEYCESLASISLPNATKIGFACFKECTSLASISIPNVTSLDSYFFQECTSLTSISLPNVTNLGNQCFYGCTSLASISIPNVTSLGSSCFQSCTSLASISLPNVTNTGNYCFGNCTSLASVTLGATGIPVTSRGWGKMFAVSSPSIHTSPTAIVIIYTVTGDDTGMTGSPWGGTTCTFVYKKA